MNKAVEKIAIALSAPIRFAVRYELRRARDPAAHSDIAAALQREALASTATYVGAHLRDVDSVSAPLDLLTQALFKATTSGSGLVCEFGVFSGITINHIAACTPSTVYGFDSFAGLPERWREGFGQGFFATTTRPAVRANVVLIEGSFADTLPPFIHAHPEKVSFLHIDCDLYSSTRTVLEALRDRILPGCVIVFDEYFNYPGWEEGEYKAFQEFISASGKNYRYLSYSRFDQQVGVQIV